MRSRDNSNVEVTFQVEREGFQFTYYEDGAYEERSLDNVTVVEFKGRWRVHDGKVQFSSTGDSSWYDCLPDHQQDYENYVARLVVT